ncbi:serine/threonine-protein kinase DCLK3 [Bombina bombina]|uniref:serine/threonine-protein kinase DCLK3 n=1 Tax=Bombina bombina TaxID=8345 RepID=UPI00235AA7E5|nr:serine/threonine-protein kinase DCLK3 [Bombina bombina]
MNIMNSRSTDRKSQITCPGNSLLRKQFPGISTNTLPYFNSRSGFHTTHSENSPVKPRIVTVVKPGSPPLRKITLLLNKRAVQTFEQLVADISEALGLPRWKNDRVRKLYSLSGKEIRSISDFFRGDDVFIAIGRKQLTMKNIEIVFNELYPDKPFQHYENLNCKLRGKGLNRGSSYKDIDIVNNRSDNICIQKLVRTNGIINTKCEEEERRPYKYDSETSRNDKEKTLGLIKNSEPCKQKMLQRKTSNSSLNYKNSCEQCKKIKCIQKLHSDIENEISCADSRHLPDKEGTSKCHRKSLIRNSQATKKADGNVDKYMKPNRKNSRVDSKSEETLKSDYLKTQCSTVKKNSCKVGDHSSEKSTIDDFLERPKKSMKSLKENMRIVKNSLSNEIEIMEKRDSTTTKCRDRTPELKKKENGILSLRRPCCIKNKGDIEYFYEIGKIIGDGNFATVKMCKLRNIHEEYAMKIIDKSKHMGKEIVIANEVRIMKCLSHPNIVKLLDNYETDAEIYLILEYVNGGDLFDAVIENIKFTETDAAFMLTDVCEALVYIHNKNIVHRDLKPENLLVQNNPDGSKTLKVADFGLAAYVTGPIFTVCGTPTYVSPEIISEKGYGLEVDMWATGVILYIILCGYAPFRSKDHKQEELFKKIQQGEYKFHSQYWDNISEEAKDLIRRLLVLDPKERLSAGSVLQHDWIRMNRKVD